ncbi:hypothetical protein ACROYT_G033637 [Oculina patagonica]
MNSSNGTPGVPPPAHPSFSTLQTTAFTVLYCIAILMALIGNVLLIFIVKRKPDARTLTGFLFVNMAVADLLVTFTVMPISLAWLYTDGGKWLPVKILSDVTCTLVYYIFFVTIAASIFSLTLMSVDRYLGVVFPLRRFPRFRGAKVLTVLIWLSSMIFAIPAAVTWEIYDAYKPFGLYICGPNFLLLGEFGMKWFYMYLFLLMYLIPLIVMSSLYILIGRALWLRNVPGRQFTNGGEQRNEMTKRKVVRTLIIITAVFAFCWLPTQCYHLILAFRPDIHDTAPLYVQSLCFWLGHANSAINPWLYMMLSDSFRKSLCDVVHRGRYSRFGSRSRAQSSTRYTSVVQNSVKAHHANRKQRNGLLHQDQEDVCRETVL